MISRTEILEMLVDLSSPIGPEVLAGLGSEFQNKVNADPLHHEKFKDEWEKATQPAVALPILVDIAISPPKPEDCFGLHIRRANDWDYHLTDLIYRMGKADFNQLIKTTEEICGNNRNPIIAEAVIWIEKD